MKVNIKNFECRLCHENKTKATMFNIKVQNLFKFTQTSNDKIFQTRKKGNKIERFHIREYETVDYKCATNRIIYYVLCIETVLVV